MSESLATFGAGCFWGVEDRFRQLTGVIETEVGYMGGHLDQPTYEDVCNDTSGHAEVVHLKFDPDQISYEQLLKVFWENHNPTTVNRQGPDVGTQYRSVIFTHSDEQREVAVKAKAELEASHVWKQPIVTEIVPAQPFYRAEEYHQKYFMKNGGSCHI
ncbi:peptide-methionine (S)-S-oxide reductase MsrA [Patescibacteria group bacterium]|nr:peptide-methionine (S)-S-oxide reductase MsrA [Patescibacteria group bacterium]